MQPEINWPPSGEAVQEAWDIFRREELGAWMRTYREHYRREFFGMLTDDVSTEAVLRRIVENLETRHQLSHDYFGEPYLKTELELISLARDSFERTWTRASKAPGEQSLFLVPSGELLREAAQISERYLATVGALKLLEEQGTGYMKAWLE